MSHEACAGKPAVSAHSSHRAREAAAAAAAAAPVPGEQLIGGTSEGTRVVCLGATSFYTREFLIVYETMHDEVKLGASYIVRLLNRHQKLDTMQVERFTETLISILCNKFKGHWYPDSPQKGQAYRCIRIEHNMVIDDSVLRACIRSGVRCSQLAFPKNMSIWIDPQEVSCRLGESCCPFIVKLPEESEKTLKKPELDTSDYHSDGSDRSGSPGSSSEDDEIVGGKNISVIDTRKMGAKYYYNPVPSSTVYYQYPGSTVTFIPSYQPMTVYYLVPKYYHNIRSQGAQTPWKFRKLPPPTKD